MIKNYFKIAFRNLVRNQSNSVINVIGLAIGIACCLLILLWVSDELSYDKWNSKADRTYRLASDINFAGSHQQYAVSPSPLAPALVSDFPEVEASMRFRSYGSYLVKRFDQNYKERRVILADSSLFKVFDLELIEGTEDALKEPNTVVISESMAEKYFGEENALGENLTFDDRTDYEITGIIKDMPIPQSSRVFRPSQIAPASKPQLNYLANQSLRLVRYHREMLKPYRLAQNP